MTDLSGLTVYHLKTLRCAINKTIKAHQAALDGEFPNYYEAKNEMFGGCPLCVALVCRNYQGWQKKGGLCPWILFTDEQCTEPDQPDYDDDVSSIERLNAWNNQIRAELTHRVDITKADVMTGHARRTQYHK